MATSGVGPAGPSGLWLSRALCTSWRSSKSFPVACNLSDNKKLSESLLDVSSLAFKKDTSIPSSARDNSDWKSIFVASPVDDELGVVEAVNKTLEFSLGPATEVVLFISCNDSLSEEIVTSFFLLDIFVFFSLLFFLDFLNLSHLLDIFRMCSFSQDVQQSIHCLM